MVQGANFNWPLPPLAYVGTLSKTHVIEHYINDGMMEREKPGFGNFFDYVQEDDAQQFEFSVIVSLGNRSVQLGFNLNDDPEKRILEFMKRNDLSGEVAKHQLLNFLKQNINTRNKTLRACRKPPPNPPEGGPIFPSTFVACTRVGSGIRATLQKINSSVDGSVALSAECWQNIETIFSILFSGTNPSLTEFSSIGLDTVDHMFRWPNKHLPFVCDLLRLLLLHESAAKYYTKKTFDLGIWKSFAHSLQREETLSKELSIMSLQVMINLFHCPVTFPFIIRNQKTIVDLIEKVMKSTQNNTNLADVYQVSTYVAQVGLNFVNLWFQPIISRNTKAQVESVEAIMSFAVMILLRHKDNPKTNLCYSALCILGTILYDAEFFLHKSILEIFTKHSDTKVSSLAKWILLMYQSGFSTVKFQGQLY
eukprot:TRINITY_DN4726_c0_g1_i11.p1 TRINITY_DN4726_c0_g1~~TRINITY_DN4726_c0_g1_i11.p1  ORF type:complete len:422 (+),score=75.01 TRINITY_DN4726_c0_g1_i11:768-2033(+)